MAAWPGARPGTGTHRAQDTDLRFRLVAQRYRHNTLCRHELGRRVASFKPCASMHLSLRFGRLGVMVPAT